MRLAGVLAFLPNSARPDWGVRYAARVDDSRWIRPTRDIDTASTQRWSQAPTLSKCLQTPHGFPYSLRHSLTIFATWFLQDSVFEEKLVGPL